MTSRVITIGKRSEHGSLPATLITSNNSPARRHPSPLPPPFPSVRRCSRSFRGRGILRGFPEEFSANLVGPYVRPDKKSAQRQGRAGRRGRLERRLAVEIRFSVDRYNPTLHKRSSQASRSRHSRRDGDSRSIDGSIVADIVPDVARIMRLQITDRLRASAAKLTNQRPIVVRA